MKINTLVEKKLKLQWLYKQAGSHKGFTMIEIMIVLALAAIMTAMSAPYISFGNNPLQDNTNRIASKLKLVRSKAISQTSAYRVTQISPAQLKVEHSISGKNCLDEDNNAAWVKDPSFTEEDLSLNEASDIQGINKNTAITIVAANTINGSSLTNWKLCYDSRGTANKNLFFTLTDTNNKKRQIEVFSGGGVQIYGN